MRQKLSPKLVEHLKAPGPKRTDVWVSGYPSASIENVVCSDVGDPYYYWLAAGAGIVIVLTLRAPGHGCGSDTGPDGFGEAARSPSGYCDGGSNEFSYRVCP
jgi:hypothetical protein